MWALENNTPFAAERGWVRDKDGAERWLVVVKATFDIGADGSTHVAEAQEPVSMAPVFRGDPAATSLISDTDLVRSKSATDVLVNGHVHAVQPVRQLDFGFQVGPISKRLHAIGDRRWVHTPLGIEPTEPREFIHLPLVWERAFGGTIADEKRPGWEPRNPVGTGFAFAAEQLLDRPLPNIFYPDSKMRQWNDRPRPAGVGPIPRHWVPRLQYCGTYDAAWEEERRPLEPLDLDDRLFQCAPEDQQVPGFLKGGEEVVLWNLSPGGGVLRFRLPRVTLGFRTYFKGGAYADHRADLHTVVLHSDGPRVSMSWQTSLSCHFHVQKLLATRILVKERLFARPDEPAGATPEPAAA